MLKQISLLLLTVLFLGCESNSEEGPFTNPADENSSYPYLFSTGSDLYMSWLTENNESHSLNYAHYSDGTWSDSKTIATDSTWFINWADFPSIIADQDGPIAAHWLNKKPGGPYAYDVNIATAGSFDNWNEAFVPHKDSTATEHGFVSIIPWDDDTILAVWLDGRQTAGRSGEEYFDLNNAMTLRGALITRDGQVTQDFLIDESVCDCCPTSLVKTDKGAVVAYRNRTDNEVRDIYTSRFDGEEWTSPEAVFDDGWEIGACPVNGPKLAANDSLIAVAWHTGANDNPTVKYAYSSDQGATFSEPVSLNETTSLGRVDAEIVNGNTYISWMEKSNEKTELKVAVYNRDKPTDNPKTVATLNEARKTGFPQMEAVDDQLILAWTNADSTKNYIQTKRLRLPLSL